MKLILCLLFTLLFSAQAEADSDAHTYFRLDSMLALQQELTDENIKQINVVKSTLADPDLTDAERYAINERLYQKYEAFIYDSAFKYVDRTVALARKLNDPHRLTRSLLGKVHIISVAGLFDEAERILRSISEVGMSREDLVEYYYTWNELYIYKAEFSQGTPYYHDYIARAMDYRKRVIDLASRDSYLYVSALSSYVCEQRQYDRAIALLSAHMGQLRPGNRRYSVLTSTLAFFYDCKHDEVNRRKYLILSAISDLQGCIRENNSLRELSSMLFAEGHMDRAYRYLHISIKDANFYGTRLRNIQASQLIPQIVAGYEAQQTAQHGRTVVLIIVLSFTTVLLIVALGLVYMFMKRYRLANGKVQLMNRHLKELVEKLRSMNGQMREGNKIKEEYIGRFLELSSTLIDHAEQERKHQNRLARDHKLPELYASLKDSSFMTENTRLFYRNFDSAFLNIYPHFVAKVNELLMPEGQIELRQGEKLSTELRILALIRLGITDNQRISAVLRSSITTIYTYRSKLKARAVDRDNFELRVAEIDAYEKGESPKATSMEG